MRDRRPLLILVAILGLGLLLAGWGLYMQQQRIASNAERITQQRQRADGLDAAARAEQERTSRELRALEALVRRLGGTPPPRTGTAPATVSPAAPTVVLVPQGEAPRAADRSPRPTPSPPAPSAPPQDAPSRPVPTAPAPTSPAPSPSPTCLVMVGPICLPGG